MGLSRYSRKTLEPLCSDRLISGLSAHRMFQTEHYGKNLLCLLKFFCRKLPQTSLETMPLNRAKAGQVDNTGLGEPRRLWKWDFALTPANFTRERSDQGNGSLLVRIGAQD